MNLLKRFERCLARWAPAPVDALLACSGGADSVALVVAWHSLAADRGDRLTLAHFNHRWRAEADDDCRFVERLAEQLDLPIVVGDAHAEEESAAAAVSKRRRTPEEAARIQRYRFLAATAGARGCRVVATAHTREDRVETTLFSILRGTGLRGLASIPVRRTLRTGDEADAQLIRPMLEIGRADIEAFLAGHNQAFCSDATNADTQHTRNRIRHELLPHLRRDFNPEVDAALVRLAEHAAAADAVVARLARRLVDRACVAFVPGKAVAFRLDPLRRSEGLLAGRAILETYDRQRWPRGSLTAAHVRRLLDALDDRGPRRIELPEGIVAEVDRTSRPRMMWLTKSDADGASAVSRRR